MKLRDPLLYEQMVGRYLSDDEIQDMVDRSDLRFSSILTKHMDVQESNIIYNLQKEIEVCKDLHFLLLLQFLPCAISCSTPTLFKQSYITIQSMQVADLGGVSGAPQGLRFDSNNQ